MKTEKIVWGLVLVFLGGILLLQNLEIIDFYWQVVFRFWPVILILIGANLLFSRDDSRVGALMSVLLTVLALGFITYKGITTDRTQEYSWSFGDHEGVRSKTTTDVFSEEFNDSISSATLNISGGATQYILSDTSSSLIEAEVKKNFGKYSLYRTTKDSSEILNFKMNGKSSKLDLKNNSANKVTLRLNSKPVWDINLEMGAGTAKFDLTDMKIKKIAIEGGAASFKIKLGKPQETTTVSVETGVSEIDISIPRGSACIINTESGLSSNNFKDFTKQADGTYLSRNYKAASEKFVINLEGGLSNFKVQQY